MHEEQPLHRFRYRGMNLAFVDYNPDDHINTAMKQSQSFYELPMLEDIRSRLLFAKTAVDVGAHVGNHTIFFARALNMDVIAIEPNNNALNILRTNLKLNSIEHRVDIHDCAAGPDTHRGRLIHGPRSNSGMARIEPSEHGDIPIVPLDDLIDRPFQLLKIDVEGGAAGVITGGMRAIRAHRPLIYVEVDESSFVQVSLHLQSAGYVPWKRFNHTPTILFLPSERLSPPRAQVHE